VDVVNYRLAKLKSYVVKFIYYKRAFYDGKGIKDGLTKGTNKKAA